MSIFRKYWKCFGQVSILFLFILMYSIGVVFVVDFFGFDWVIFMVGFNYVVFGSNQFIIYGNINYWNFDFDQNGLWDYLEIDNWVYDYFVKWNVFLIVNLVGF